MNEIEVKARVSSLEEIRSKLKDLGCVFSEPKIQKDRIYLQDEVDFKNKTKGDLYLRIRNSNGKNILTLKKQLNTENENIEHEFAIDNPEAADNMAKLLGFSEVLSIAKKRICCDYRETRICLDEVERLGFFIEAEKLTDEKDTEKVREELFEFLKNLGIKEEDRVEKGYATMIFELENK